VRGPGAGDARRGAGFTMIEMVVTIGITAMLITAVGTMYVQLTDASERATAYMRETRSATAVLDRVARDLRGAFLIRKPDDVDPLEHPWVFVAESAAAQDGADRVRFTTISQRTSRQEGHVSDIGTMAYVLHPNENDAFALYRWAETRRPEQLDRRFPGPDDPGVALVADDLAFFSMRFLSADGAWVDSWDSSLIAQSSELPIAVDIEIGRHPQDAQPLGFGEAPEVSVYSRRVVLPQRPMDFEQLAGLGEEGTGTGDTPENQDSDGDGIPDTEDPDQQDRCPNGTMGRCIYMQDREWLDTRLPEDLQRLSIIHNACLDNTLQVPDIAWYFR